MRIAIDFELVNTREGRINPQAKDAISAWLAAGHTVEIYSTSEYITAHDVADYMRGNGFAGAKNLVAAGAPRWNAIVGKGTLDGAAPWSSIKSSVAKLEKNLAAKRAATERRVAKANAGVSARMREDAVRDLERFKAKYGDLLAHIADRG